MWPQPWPAWAWIPIGVHGVDSGGVRGPAGEDPDVPPPPDRGRRRRSDQPASAGSAHRSWATASLAAVRRPPPASCRLKAREREGILPCPMMAVNDAKAKHYYDNKYGTGQSVLGRHHAHHQPDHRRARLWWSPATAGAARAWPCGPRAWAANVIVTEVDPFKALEATMDGLSGSCPWTRPPRYGRPLYHRHRLQGRHHRAPLRR